VTIWPRIHNRKRTPVCDKPYHMNNGFQQLWVEIKMYGTIHSGMLICFTSRQMFFRNSMSTSTQYGRNMVWGRHLTAPFSGSWSARWSCATGWWCRIRLYTCAPTLTGTAGCTAHTHALDRRWTTSCGRHSASVRMELFCLKASPNLSRGFSRHQKSTVHFNEK